MNDLQQYFNKMIIKLKECDEPDYYKDFLKMKEDILYKAFWLACMYDEVDIIKTIYVSYQIDIERTDFCGNTPFLLACSDNQRLEVIQYLYSITIDRNHQNDLGSNAMFLASIRNNIDIMKYLIDKCGFDPKCKRMHWGWNCFLMACATENFDIVKYLCETYNFSGSTSICDENGLILACAHNKKTKVIQYVIKKCLITQKDKSGKNSSRNNRYDGPCPPKSSEHRYYFKVFALDTILEDNLNKEDLERAMRNRIIASGQIIGLFSS
ncbi:MAG: kinase inhibitor [Dasosvirus sp.]|uniref:Kinase inhibitor n=1 Tax=Dasosvirus sp. TaxID=2487764 RepID=A0A3G4ZTS0_9VIRU|nr:MAG: kinase inhibitor [Dasosvirus sp.]